MLIKLSKVNPDSSLLNTVTCENKAYYKPCHNLLFYLVLISHPVLNPHLLLSLPSCLSQFLMINCQMLMGSSYGVDPEEYINAALTIYMNIVLIFLCLLGRRWNCLNNIHILYINTHRRTLQTVPTMKMSFIIIIIVYIMYFKWQWMDDYQCIDRILALSLVYYMNKNEYKKPLYCFCCFTLHLHPYKKFNYLNKKGI